MELSKAFDTINHDFLVAKLHTYGFSNDSLKLLYSYLKIDGIEQKLTTNLGRGKSWVKVFLKGLSLDLFYLISI